eukprot:s3446_g5.t1
MVERAAEGEGDPCEDPRRGRHLRRNGECLSEPGAYDNFIGGGFADILERILPDHREREHEGDGEACVVLQEIADLETKLAVLKDKARGSRE